jgi:hypothetical protein
LLRETEESESRNGSGTKVGNAQERRPQDGLPQVQDFSPQTNTGTQAEDDDAQDRGSQDYGTKANEQDIGAQPHHGAIIAPLVA